MNAVSLKIAEEYVNAFGKLAKTSNTVLLPSNTGDISNMVATVSNLLEQSENSVVWVRINPLLDNKILDWSKLKEIIDDILRCIQNENQYHIG